MIIGVQAGIEVDIQCCVEVGLGVAAAKHRVGVGCTGRGAGDRRASKVCVQR